MTIDSWISGHAAYSPDKVALLFEDQAVTYADLQQRVEQTACLLEIALGLNKGDRFAFLGFNHPEIVVLLFAAARIGVAAVPLNWRLSDAEIAYILESSGAQLLFHDDAFADTAGRLQIGSISKYINFESAAENSLAQLRLANGDAQSGVGKTKCSQSAVSSLQAPFLIVYTSGTTGQPKGAVLDQQAMICNARMSQHMYDMTSDDHILNVLPLFHVGGINIQPLPALALGATVTLHRKFEPDLAIAALCGCGITLINCVPTILQALLDHPGWNAEKFKALRAISIGSTDVPVSMIQQLHQQGLPLLQVYGATETSPIAIYQRLDNVYKAVGSIGRAGLLCEIRLARPDGSICDVDERGEIHVRGDNVLQRYWNNERATAENIVDGWFRTGDVASVDKNGDYWFADRIKHVIISGGENIYAAEVERVLRDVPGIAEVAVAGRPHPQWGEVPVALVVRSQPSLTMSQILDSVSPHLARFKCPRDFIFTDALPRNAMGKVVFDKVRHLVQHAHSDIS